MENDKHNEGSPAIDGSTAFDDDLPDEILQLVRRCEINEHTFDNDDMSVALQFGELLWRRLKEIEEHYERQSGIFIPNGIRSLRCLVCDRDANFEYASGFDGVTLLEVFRCERCKVKIERHCRRDGTISRIEVGRAKP